MHAVLITFTTAATDDELAGPMQQFAEIVRNVSGLQSKAWLHDGATHGGFYLFVDEAAARAYTDGPVVASVRANSAFDDVRVRAFAVNTELSAYTGVGSDARV